MGSTEGCRNLPTFVEGKIQEQKLVDGNLFPKVFMPFNGVQKEDIQALLQTIKSNKSWLEDELTRYSALVFRGFPVRSPADFKAVVEAFGWEEQKYLGFTPRSKVEDRVYTANEGPLHEKIDFHHEMTMMKVWPSKLFFFCQTASQGGGETAIVLSHLVPPRMEEILPEFVKKVKEVGLLFKITTPGQDTIKSFIGKTWQTITETTDPTEAKKRAADTLGCTQFKCNEDGTADLVFGPMKTIRTFEKGKEVWFNIISGYGEKNKNQSITLGDGSAIPAQAVEAFKRIMDEECVNLKWEEGDVLLLNNLAVQHGRRPAKPPKKVFVSICK